jgi:hypothetical protein
MLCIKVNLSFMHKPTNTHFTMSSCVCLLFLAPACFGHSCDHHQGVRQYKYQEYNRNHIKCTIKFSKMLSIIQTAFCCALPAHITACSQPNNTVIFYNILPYSEESFKRFYAAFIMDRNWENVIMYFMRYRLYCWYL